MKIPISPCFSRMSISSAPIIFKTKFFMAKTVQVTRLHLIFSNEKGKDYEKNYNVYCLHVSGSNCCK